MAIRQITSQPKPSAKHPGWLYAYYNKPTARGGECTALISPAVKDIVKPGFAFDDACVTWHDALQASVLALDFDEAPDLGEPSVPADPDNGWGDPDPLIAAAPSGNGNGHTPPQPPQRAGARPQTLRKHEAQQRAIEGCQLPAAYLKINLEVSRSFLLQYSLISSAVGEARRADVAQKLTAIASIPYFRQVGIELSEDDIKGMTSL